MNLSKHVKISQVVNEEVSAMTVITSDSVDMQGFDGVVYAAIIGTSAASGIVALQGEGSDDDTIFTNQTEAVVTGPADSSDKFLVLDVYRPSKRFNRVLVNRTVANSSMGGVLAIQYMGSKKPTAHDAAKLAAEALAVSPTEV